MRLTLGFFLNKDRISSVSTLIIRDLPLLSLREFFSFSRNRGCQHRIVLCVGGVLLIFSFIHLYVVIKESIRNYSTTIHALSGSPNAILRMFLKKR